MPPSGAGDVPLKQSWSEDVAGKTTMKGANFSAPDLAACSAWHCSMVLPCAASHHLLVEP